MADGRHIESRFLNITQQPDFSVILRAEAVFHRISAMEQIPALHRTHFFVFVLLFGLPRAAPFVSSPIHLLC